MFLHPETGSLNTPFQRQDSGTREKKDSLSETVAAPPKSAPTPPLSAPPTPSPEPEFTGDDVVDMFG